MLEARLRPLAIQWLEARFDASVAGRREPAAPAELQAAESIRLLAHLAGDNVRARQLWRLCQSARAKDRSGLADALAIDDVSMTMLDRAIAAGLDRAGRSAVTELDADSQATIGRVLARKDAVAEGVAVLAELGVDVAHADIRRSAAARTSCTYFIDPPARIAVVLAGIEPALASWRRVWHELGHVALAACHDPRHDWCMRDAPSPVVHEAFAELFAAQLERADTLARLLDVDADRAEGIAEWRRQHRRRWLRWICEHAREVDRPGGNARYIVADQLALRLRQGGGDVGDTFRAAGAAGAHYEWKPLLDA